MTLAVIAGQTTTPRLTREQAIEKIRPHVEARPDYVYEKPVDPDYPDDPDMYGCRYFDFDGAPSCLIGHGFEDELRPHIQGIEGCSAVSLQPTLGVDDRAIAFLTEVQMKQDRGVPWGEAFTHAVEVTDPGNY